MSALQKSTADQTISRRAPCPCGSGRKYKKCCMPPHERLLPAGESSHGDFVNPGRPGKGMAALMVEFSQPLLEAAHGNPEAMNKALNFGMIFWNLATVGREFALEELPKIEKGMCKSDEDRRNFRSMARMMFERYQNMRSGAGENLISGLEEIWGPDFSAGLGESRLNRIAGMVRGLLK